MQITIQCVFLAYFDPKLYTLSKKLQFSQNQVNQHFSAMYSNSNFVLVMSIETRKKHTQKWNSLIKVADIFPTPKG